MKEQTLFSVVVVFTLFLMPNGVVAQDEVSGTVQDAEDGTPLVGVNVVVQGTTQGTTTGAGGEYQLNVPSDADTLVFSFVGYQERQIPIEGRSQIDVEMTSGTVMGEEVVVVGYGEQEKRQVTGSVTSVGEADFIQGNVNSPEQMLQGRVAGLQVTNRSGDPNDQSEIRLRGISSFGANQEPLIVVDGIIGASFDNIDPSDIESIDVLKDASSSAIYGTRGSAGAIVITTKSGQGQDLSVNYRASYTLEGIENKMDALSADEFRELSDVTGFDIQDLGASTDYFDEVTQLGQNNVHNLALSGGTENTSYRISGNYRNRDGIQKYTGFQKIGGRLNITQSTLDDRLSLTLQLSGSNNDRGLGFADAFRYAGVFNPTTPVTDDGYENTGGYVEQPLFDYFNPVNIIEEGERTAEETILSGALRAEYSFENYVEGLSISGFFSRETTSDLNRLFASKEHKLIGGATVQSRGPGQAERSTVSRRSDLYEATLNYTTDIDDLGLDLVGGYSYTDRKEEGSSASGGDFVVDAVKHNNLSFAQDFDQGEGDVNSFKNSSRIIGGFGRLSANWDNTYFINTSLRREGSSRFGEDNRWGTFWSAGGSVEVTNLVELPFFNSLRARGSIGVTGQDAPEDGLAVQRFAPQGNFFVDGAYIQSFGPVSNPNPNLKWEEKTEINVGIEFEAIDRRLRGTVEGYNSVTSDLLFEVGVPVPPNLFPTTWKNVGELETTGLEFDLGYDAVQGDAFSWTTSVNGAWTSETTLNEFVSDEVRLIASPGSPGLNNPNLIRVKEGEPIGQLWGPEFSRVGSNGEWLFIDQDGNEVPHGELTPDDRKILGNGLPNLQLGMSNRFSYENVSLNIFVDGNFGHQLANMFNLFYSVPKQITSYNVVQDAFNLTDLKDDPRWSSRYVEDADYVRIRNVTLSYSFPMQGYSSVDGINLSVTGNNLYTITGYKGIDPQPRYVDENRGLSGIGETGGALAPGIERRADWFTTRSVTFSIDVQL